MYYVVHGVFCERPLELLVSVVATIIVMCYCIVEYVVHGYQSPTDIRNLKLVRLVRCFILKLSFYTRFLSWVNSF